MHNSVPSNSFDIALETYNYSTRPYYRSHSKGPLLPERMNDEHLVNTLRMLQRGGEWSRLIADIVFEVKRRGLEQLVVKRVRRDYLVLGFAFRGETPWSHVRADNPKRWLTMSFTKPRRTPTLTEVENAFFKRELGRINALNYEPVKLPWPANYMPMAHMARCLLVPCDPLPSAAPEDDFGISTFAAQMRGDL